MLRLTVCVLSLVLAGCADRALFGVNDDGGAGVDLAHATTLDFSTGPSDLAVAPADLLSPVAGIRCSSTLVCAVGDFCCVGDTTSTCATAQMGGGMTGGGACMGGAALECDGPEDCTNGRQCVATVSQDGVLLGARCRQQVPPNGVVLCHTAADCQGQTCTKVASSPTDPILGVCSQG